MSSGTSTEALPPKGGSRTAASAVSAVSIDARESRPKAADEGFHASHFFVLVSLMAATVAVVVMRPGGPESLILISLTIGAAGAAGYGCYRTFAPLVAPRKDSDRELLSDRLRTDLEREKALTLRSIKELEFDRAMGKLSTQDFDEMSGRLRARAVGIMKQLDAGSTAYRALIEKELAARIGNKAASDVSLSRSATTVRTSVVDALDSVDDRNLAQAAPAESAVPVGLCACGTSNDSDARFCKSCGAKLRAA